MWNTVLPPHVTQAFATDLSGNVIWTYTYQGATGDIIQGVQLLPNGHLLMVISYLSSLSPPEGSDPNLINSIREVDLAGNTVRELTMDALNQKLAASTLPGFRRQAVSVQELSPRRSGPAQRPLGLLTD